MFSVGKKPKPLSLSGASLSTHNHFGNFSLVPNEMLENINYLDLTLREYKICITLMRLLIGWQMKERLISTKDILQGANLIKQNGIPAINSLLKKEIIFRTPGKEHGEYVYSFNEKVFGRTHASRFVRQDPKVIDLMTYRSSNQLPDGNQNDYPMVIEPITDKPSRSAVVAETRSPKDTKETKDILKSQKNDSNESGWDPEASQKAQQIRLSIQQQKVDPKQLVQNLFVSLG